MNGHFKTCPCCATIWSSREVFLEDRDLELIGYQADFEELALGILLFNHNTCKTTLAIRAFQLKDLYRGPVFTERRTGQKECPRYCLKISELAACPAQCECAWVRGLMQIILAWPKNAGSASSTSTGRT
jgi:hypothetical protein